MFKTLRGKLLFGVISSIVIINIIFTSFIMFFLQNKLKKDIIAEISNIKKFAISNIKQNEVTGESKWKSLKNISTITNSYVSLANEQGKIDELINIPID